MVDHRADEPPTEGVPQEALDQADSLLARLRAEGSAEPGLQVLGRELVAFEDQTGRQVSSLLGDEQAGLGLGMGDLRDPRAFLRTLVCQDKEVRLRTKLAIKGGLPAVITAVGTGLIGLGAVPAGILASTAAVVAYEGVEKLCDGGR